MKVLVTDKSAEEAVMIIPEYATRSQEKIYWSEKVNLLKNLCKALDQKHTNLIQLSANVREEKNYIISKNSFQFLATQQYNNITKSHCNNKENKHGKNRPKQITRRI